MINFFRNLFRNKKSKPKRLDIKDVKPGQMIRIEWSEIQGNIGYLTCINNDPGTKKILLEVKWKNYQEAKVPERQQIILDYKSSQLLNFHILNSHLLPKNGDDNDLFVLQGKLDEAIEREEYERAAEIQKKIDSFNSK